MSLTYEQRHHLRHQISQHLKARLPVVPACKSCDAPLDTQTYGCKTCADRARRRKRRNTTTAGQCKGCGINIHTDQRTPGCQTCNERAWRRTYRAKKEAA